MSAFVDWFSKVKRFGLEYMSLYYGSYRAFVMDNKDPDNRNRLKLKIPTVYGNQISPMWVDPINTFGGKGYGIQVLPQIGDTVFVEFEYGNVKFPMWKHGYFAKGEKPNDNDPNTYWFKTPKGHLIKLNDTQEQIEIIDKHGHKVILNSKGVSIVANDSISLGSLNKSKEPGVLGDTNEKRLNEILDLQNKLLVQLTTYFTAQSAVVANPPFTPLTAAITTILPELAKDIAEYSQIRAQVPLTKSTKITLD